MIATLVVLQDHGWATAAISVMAVLAVIVTLSVHLGPSRGAR